MSTGTLKVTIFNSHLGTSDFVGKYHFVLFKSCDPNNIIATFMGELTQGETKTYTVDKLAPGNYQLFGLKLPDPKPGNKRNHDIQIFAGLDTVYDVCYLKNTIVL